MRNPEIKYTAVIRTLGKAGEKFQRELDSLCAQTIQPEEIIVYIAEGYPLPKETCGRERYVYVKKGMVAQRALPYDEVTTEWILFLDDDVYLPPTGVESLFKALEDNGADVVSPDVFDNASRGLKSELMMTLSGRMRARRGDSRWAYKIMPTCGYSYNKSPEARAYLSQSNAGPCFLCRKSDFQKIHLEEELWLDRSGYPIGEDQVLFYKMYLLGLRQLTLFGSGIRHLDAGFNLGNKEKELKTLEADSFFRSVFWRRFIQEPETSALKRMLNSLAINYFFGFSYVVSALKGDKAALKAKRAGRKAAREFLNSDRFSSLPKITKKI